ncbi:hypothetical protein BK816_05925 [Boudabousia tangfeifanii]|uniref:4'-phosphopantetheinyl transferase domain-containing protein n=2 Tax=Boudabousia tangfeifanii TaxID=1912795 RepID=A0A1D9MKP6_9ACTO|nr:hypothetical protein BK816_05925 [Boudabousia tangfeifanii]
MDTVKISDFAAQLQMPGSTFSQVFTAQEQQVASLRPAPAASLAARWAAKEALVKAWSQALGPLPLPLPDSPAIWSQIEVVSDSVHRPRLVLSGEVLAAFSRTCPGAMCQVSLCHEDDFASAIVIVSGSGANPG